MVNCSPTEFAGMRSTNSLAESAAVPSTSRPLLASTFTFVVTAGPFRSAGTGSRRASWGGADGAASCCPCKLEGRRSMKQRKTGIQTEINFASAIDLKSCMAGLQRDRSVEFEDGLEVKRRDCTTISAGGGGKRVPANIGATI